MLAYWVIILGSEFSNLSQRPMMGAIIDQDEQTTGVRKAGLFVGLNALLTIPVSGIQAAIFTTLISRYGFASGGTLQSARALTGIRIGAGVIPFGFVLLGILPILLSPINRTREKELSDFAERRHRVLAQDQPLAMEG
jgi:glycoside/pentoside/hexuronide:cation symporter, GPH family